MTNLAELTYEERHLLALLLDGPRHDHDTMADRVLINSGLAERIAIGQMQLTAPGRELALMESRTNSRTDLRIDLNPLKVRQDKF